MIGSSGGGVVMSKDSLEKQRVFEEKQDEIRRRKKKASIEQVQAQMFRNKQVREWNKLTDVEQVKLRALRSKKGVKCEVCKSLGYFKEICPNSCAVVITEDIDSEDEETVEQESVAGDCYLWNNPSTTTVSSNLSAANTTLESDLKERLKTEQQRLQESDEDLFHYMFFSKGQVGYNRNQSELTLHQVLRYLMRSLEADIRKNVQRLECDPSDDLTLFHPPKHKPGKTFYPAHMEDIKQYRDYFAELERKKDRKKKAHDYRGLLRGEEANAVHFRGKLGDDNSLYVVDKKAGGSMHSKIGWKSILSSGDGLAISDPTMAKKMEHMEKMLSKQSAWTNLQKKDFEYRNDMYAHLVQIIKYEMKQEHDREKRLLTADVSAELKGMQAKVWQERLESADRIMQTVFDYDLSNGTGKADFFSFCLGTYKEGIIEKYFPNKGKEMEAIEGGDSPKPVKKTMKKSRFSSLKVTMTNTAPKKTTKINKLSGLASSPKLHIEDKLRDDSYKTHASEFSMPHNDKNPLEFSVSLNSRLMSLQTPSKFGSDAYAPSVTTNTIESTLGLEEFDPNAPQPAARRAMHTAQLTMKESEKMETIRVNRSYSDIGLKTHVRTGHNHDSVHLAPALIPLHLVLSDKPDGSDGVVKSHIAKSIVHDSRMKRLDPISCTIPPKFVNLYVRSTLMEPNGTTPGGDQMYSTLAKDRRYSPHLNRSMAVLEPGALELPPSSLKHKASKPKRTEVYY